MYECTCGNLYACTCMSILKTHDALVLWEGLRLGFPLFLGFGMGAKRVGIVE